MSGFLPSIFGGRISNAGDPPSPASSASADPEPSHVNLFETLSDALPSRLAQYANEFISAAKSYAPASMKTFDFCLVHAAVIDRESGGGIYLKPRGAGGTGDPAPRWYVEASIPRWAYDHSLVSGQTRTNDDGEEEFQVVPPAFAGATVPGWGYGLGQIDFASNREWLAANEWQKPDVNLLKSAAILSDAINSTQDVRLGVAAYNAGVARVKRHAADPDSVTTGHNYSADVLARAGSWGYSAA